jgi:hypothetical protein
MMIIPPTSVVRVDKGDRITSLFVAAAYDRLWHKADMPTRSNDVRSWEQSGHF